MARRPPPQLPQSCTRPLVFTSRPAVVVSAAPAVATARTDSPAPAAPRGARALQVFAAASLADASTRVDALLLLGPESGVKASFGASSVLARQIEAGAPAEVFLSAGRDGRLATGDSDSVPAGRYARASLIKPGVWAQVSGRLAAAENARVVLRTCRAESPRTPAATPRGCS